VADVPVVAAVPEVDADEDEVVEPVEDEAPTVAPPVELLPVLVAPPAPPAPGSVPTWYWPEHDAVAPKALRTKKDERCIFILVISLRNTPIGCPDPPGPYMCLVLFFRARATRPRRPGRPRGWADRRRFGPTRAERTLR
jgi:hypothetical protein